MDLRAGTSSFAYESCKETFGPRPEHVRAGRPEALPEAQD